MPEGQDRYFEPVDGLAHIEQLASVGTRIRRKKEQNQQTKERKQRKKAGIEETLQDEQEQIKKQSHDKDGHVDFHA